MKNVKRMGYILLIVILLVLSLTIYTNASKDNSQNQKEKTFSQIKYIEGKLAGLLNTMNNIEVRNYSVVTSELSKETTKKSGSDNSSSKSGTGGGSSGGDGSSEGGTSGGRFIWWRRLF